MRSCLTLAGLLVLVASAPAAVKPAPIFGKGMVLQRGMPLPIWGTADPDEAVTVSCAGQTKKTTAGADGKWLVRLDALEAGGPHTLAIEGKNKVALDDVLVGEVWLCSGQSNMVWRLKQSENATAESATADLPLVRYNGGRGWQPVSPTTAPEMSACAYYFGRDLAKALGVPIGLVNRSVGGTSARLWTAPEVIESEPGLRPYLGAIQQEVKGKKANYGQLYNAHIRPLVGFAIRGVIWYQGESDAGRPDEYGELFPTLIRSWRKAWGQGDLPFLYVQLAPIDGRRPSWERLREEQLRALRLPATAMAVIIDGDVGIHPKKKQLPGTRLALAARAVAYGERVVYSGPLYRTARIEGDRAIVQFDHVGGGLEARGETLKGFTVVDADGKSHPAEARIEGQTVVVTARGVTPVAVRYGWANDPRCNLFNKEGLPASPFRTDGGKK